MRSSINGWKTIGNTRRKNGGASPPSVRSVTAHPTWQRVYDETDPGSAEKWKLALLECLTPGCPDSRYDAWPSERQIGWRAPDQRSPMRQCRTGPHPASTRPKDLDLYAADFVRPEAIATRRWRSSARVIESAVAFDPPRSRETTGTRSSSSGAKQGLRARHVMRRSCRWA